MKKIALCFIAALLVLSCKEKATESLSDVEMLEVGAPMPVQESKTSFATTPDSIAAESHGNEDTQAKIIKNANLRFETSDLTATYGQIQEAVKKYNGIVQMDSEGTDYNSVYKNLKLRIPSANFDGFMADVSKGVKYFERKEISSEDVSEEFVDVASRIKTKKALEARYLELLKKAGKVSEMLEVEKKLFEIREEIEAKEGRLKFLQNRVSMSTVSIEFFKRTAVENGATVSYGTKIGNALKSGFNGISNFFLWLIEVWPFILILVALIYLIRKRLKKKNK